MTDPKRTKYSDPLVVKPPHYCQGSIEALDAIEASMTTMCYEGYLKGQVIKYMWRYPHKNAALQDLLKAQFYLNKLIELFEKAK
jgi:hypothetical protein